MINLIRYNIIIKNRKAFFLLLLFMFYVFLGLCISYPVFYENNIFFGADNARVYLDLTSIEFNHRRIKVHPLFLLLTQPITFVLNGLINNHAMSVIILEAFCGTMSISAFYSILQDKKVSISIRILFTLIYATSFAVVIFSTIPETFIFAAFGLTAFWRFVSLSSKKNCAFTKHEIFLLVFYGIISFGITITNYCSYLVGLIYLLFCRGHIKKKIKWGFIINAINGLVIIFLCLFQKYVWNQSPLFWTSIISGLQGGEYEETLYMNFNINVEKTIAWLKQTILYPLISPEVYMKEAANDYCPILFSGYSFWLKGILIVFLMLLVSTILLSVIKVIKNFNKEMGYVASILIAYIGNLFLHYIYGCYEAFMYSPHYLFLILVILAIFLNNIKNSNYKKILIVYFYCFLIIEFVNNMIRFFETANLALKYEGASFSLIHSIKVSLLCGIILFALNTYWRYKECRENGDKIYNSITWDSTKSLKAISLYGILTGITGLFIAFHN